MNTMRRATSKQLELIEAHERVIMKRWLRVHIAKRHLNITTGIEGIESWSNERLAETVECHGGDAELLRKRAKSAAIYQMTEGVY